MVDDNHDNLFWRAEHRMAGFGDRENDTREGAKRERESAPRPRCITITISFILVHDLNYRRSVFPYRGPRSFGGGSVGGGGGRGRGWKSFHLRGISLSLYSLRCRASSAANPNYGPGGGCQDRRPFVPFECFIAFSSIPRQLTDISSPSSSFLSRIWTPPSLQQRSPPRPLPPPHVGHSFSRRKGRIIWHHEPE